MTIEEDKQRTAALEDGTAVPSFKKDKKEKFVKRGRGRPKGTTKEFISELPAPMKKMTFKPEELFTYLQSIPKDKLTRVMLVFYRYFPICDITEGGERDKWIKRIAGESHPFIDDEWMKHILHLFGCGTYGCYLNETNAEGSSQTRMECKNIETIWDPDSYPPVVDPKTLIWTADKNQMYVQWLRSQGVQAPSEEDKEREEMEMQVADTISKLTDTVIAQANRINTPVPQIQQQPSAGERLTFEAAKAAIDMVSDQAKMTGTAQTQRENPLELVNALVSVADKMRGGDKGEDPSMKMFMTELIASRTEAARRAEAAEERHSRLLERMMTQQPTAPQPKTLIEQMTEMAQMKTLMSEAFGIGGGGKSDGDDDEKVVTSWPLLLIQSAPQLLQTGVQMWGQFNNSMAMMTRMKELEAMKATGQVPTGAVMPNPANQPAIPESTLNGNGNGNSEAPIDEVEQERIRQDQIKYAPYHPVIAAIAQPLITHLNDPGHIEDGELVKKDGYDFAEWFIAGQGRLMYDNIKTGVGLDTLMGAIKSYVPLWQQIGGIEDKVKEFITEFLGYDDLPAEVANAGQEVKQ